MHKNLSQNIKNEKQIQKDTNHWCEAEFGQVNLGDQRLKQRLISLTKCLSEQPMDPINQACETRARVKAAYRFFANPKYIVLSPRLQSLTYQ